MAIVDKIKGLCTEKGETLASLERKMDFGNGTIRKWDKALPSADKLAKVADYFRVPLDFLLGSGPFVYWDQINSDRSNFMRCADVYDGLTEWLCGFKSSDPDSASMSSFASFINFAVESARPLGQDGWAVTVRPPYAASHSGENDVVIPESITFNADLNTIVKASSKMTDEQIKKIKEVAQCLYPDAFGGNV